MEVFGSRMVEILDLLEIEQRLACRPFACEFLLQYYWLAHQEILYLEGSWCKVFSQTLVALGSTDLVIPLSMLRLRCVQRRERVTEVV